MIYEVRKNKAGKWFYHAIRSGRILSSSEAYFSKSNAKRAAKARVKKEPGSILRVVE